MDRFSVNMELLFERAINGSGLELIPLWKKKTQQNIYDIKVKESLKDRFYGFKL